MLQVYFQPNAWADEEVMLSWLEQFHADTSHIGPLLLGMDNHGAQQTPRFRARMAELNIQPASHRQTAPTSSHRAIITWAHA